VELVLGFGEGRLRVDAEEEGAGFFVIHVEDFHVHFHVGVEVAAEVAVEELEAAVGKANVPGTIFANAKGLQAPSLAKQPAHWFTDCSTPSRFRNEDVRLVSAFSYCPLGLGFRRAEVW
jgi:hypothetical protein